MSTPEDLESGYAEPSIARALEEILRRNQAGVLVQPEPMKMCPSCDSINISDGHHAGSFALPECDFDRCDDCGHIWNQR